MATIVRSALKSIREIPQCAINLIKSFEGMHCGPGSNPAADYYTPKVCPAGYPTLGYGSIFDSNGNKVLMETKGITMAEAERLLKRDMEHAAGQVSRMIRVPLNDNQFGALISFVYNLGGGALQASQLRAKLNNGDYEGAADQFGRWVNGGGRVLPGLVRRREAERRLFLGKN